LFHDIPTKIDANIAICELFEINLLSNVCLYYFQTFIRPGPEYSTLETAKFVLLKSDVEKPEDMKMNIILRKDLRTTTSQIQGSLKSLSKINVDSNPESKENIALELRKLRAG
jgi:hypothetical protein